MWSFGRGTATVTTGKGEDPATPEVRQPKQQIPHPTSSSNNTHHHHQRQYYERPMSPQIQQQLQQNVGRGRHHFKKVNSPVNNITNNNNNTSQSPRTYPLSPSQTPSPRDYQQQQQQQRNSYRNFKARKTRFGGATAGFLGNNNKKNANYNNLQGMNVDETSNGIEVSFEPPTTTMTIPPSRSSTMSPLGNTSTTSGFLIAQQKETTTGSNNTGNNSTTRRLGYKGKFHRTIRNKNGNNNHNNTNNNTTIHRKDENYEDSDHHRIPLAGVINDDISVVRTPQEPVLSFADMLRQRQWIYKSQFLTTILPTTTSTTASIVSPSSLSHIDDVQKWRPQGHRIPLCGVYPVAMEDPNTSVVNLLESIMVRDERSAVEQELSHLMFEINALERDRTFLEKMLDTVAAAATSFKEDQYRRNGDNTNSSSSSHASSPYPDGTVDWNVNVLLQEDAQKKNKDDRLPTARRMALQSQRGTCLTIHVHDSRLQEMLIQKCGGKLHHIRRTRLFKNDDTILTLSPDNCRPLGAAVTLQHVALTTTTNSTFLSSSSSSSDPSSSHGFFLSNDLGRAQSGGRIPNQLFLRMKLEEQQQKKEQQLYHHRIADLQYLSTGPCDCYYAKFHHSGDCWWGIPMEDPELQYIFQTWDVYRVAFGPIEYCQVEEEEEKTSSNNNNKVMATNSWIVLAQDGRAAWKNLPTKLSQKLECRLTTRCAPVEISLGSGGSYFVRFLDGSIDYCLPAKMARVCDRIEKMGGIITDVCLHPNISQDFIIRHSELNLSGSSSSHY